MIKEGKLVAFTQLEVNIVEGASVPTQLLRDDRIGRAFRCSLGFAHPTPAAAWQEYRYDLTQHKLGLQRQIVDLQTQIQTLESKLAEAANQH